MYTNYISDWNNYAVVCPKLSCTKGETIAQYGTTIFIYLNALKSTILFVVIVDALESLDFPSKSHLVSFALFSLLLFHLFLVAILFSAFSIQTIRVFGLEDDWSRSRSKKVLFFLFFRLAITWDLFDAFYRWTQNGHRLNTIPIYLAGKKLSKDFK